MDIETQDIIDDIQNNLSLLQEFLGENPDVQQRLAEFIREKQRE